MDSDHLFGCLSDPTRRRLLLLLAERPLCVCHFEAVLLLPQAMVSRHLAYLRRHRLVSCSRRGAWRIYALARPVPPLLATIIATLRDDAKESPCFNRDRQRLDRLSQRAHCGCETPDVPRRRLLRLARFPA